MKVIGLTGGIGSGKSTVAGFFKELGIPVYIADQAAKKIQETDETVRKKTKLLLGNDVYKNNKPDRALIASRVFGDEKKLESLNGIIHPKVREHFKKWLSLQSAPYIIYEAAILFENQGEKQCDYTILVTAPKETRVKRLIKRDGSSRKKIEARIAAQWSDEKKKQLAGFSIENLDLEKTKEQTHQLHQQLLALATR